MLQTAKRPPAPGFEPLILKGPYTMAAADFFVKRGRRGRVVAAWTERRHCNADGVIHGGFLLSLADLALTFGTFEPGDTPPRVTLSLSADFLRPARENEWLAAHSRTTRHGSNIVFADAYIFADRRLVVRASGVMRPLAPPTPGPVEDI